MPTPGSSAWRDAFWPACDRVDFVRAEFGAQRIRLVVARPAVDAFHALFDRFDAHGYPIRPQVTGVFNCRRITGGDTLSSHAYAIALDANWDTNPYTRGKLVTDMPKAMTDEIQEIRTVGGVRVWRWGGDWDHRPDTPHRFFDAMHYEVIATPDELAAGIERLIPLTPRLAAWPVLRLGARGPAVAFLQEELRECGIPVGVDGDFGPLTRRAVKDFQRRRGLKADGTVGPATWTALTHRLPALASNELRPNKRPA